MKLWLWIPLCCAALVAPAVLLARAETGFNGVVGSIESHYHVHAKRIPMAGLLSAIARRATHGGVADVHVAEFDDFSRAVDGNDFNRIVEQKLGRGWDPLVRQTSRNGREQTLIFSRPEGKRMGLFVLDLDGHELEVVQVSVDPDHLNETIARYDRHQGGSD